MTTFVPQVVRSAAVAAIILGTLLLNSGCSTPFPVVLRVPPAALDDIRSIGAVQAEFSSETGWGDGTQITNVLVVDVGVANGQAALNTATAALLTERKWTIVTENRPTIVLMHSSQWKNTRLVLRPFHPAYFEDNPDVLASLEEASVEKRSLVFLEVSEEPQAH
ncbi:hypothetical protein [Nonomuraea antimicrobica]|uniref:hypothetical protein n=1 Tax=Nonomuraea antimicrobica TaxID=561173 RepID=UPI0031E59A05